MWRISFWLFFSIGYIIINNSIKADFNTYRPNRLHFLPYFFQSTLPMWGATRVCRSDKSYFIISIHAPRAGSDLLILCITLRDMIFQSTLPVRGATYIYIYQII